MIVAMQEIATDEQIQQVIEHLVRMGFSVHRTTGETAHQDEQELIHVDRLLAPRPARPAHSAAPTRMTN